VADESGRLAQEYGAMRIDPLPDAWISMEKPWARLHPTSGRTIEMEALDGTMRVPEQAIEAEDSRVMYESDSTTRGTCPASTAGVLRL
jgi:hypothetical protein